MPVSQSLDMLRANIADIDSQIINLVKQRIDVAKQVGDYKLKNSLPIKDFKTEKVVMERCRKSAASLGLSTELAEKVTKLLIEYSVITQEEFKASNRVKISSEKKQNILIIGGLGYMGTWFANFFESFGHDIHIFDNKAEGTMEDQRFKVEKDFQKAALTADIIVLTTPISVTAEYIEKLLNIGVKALVFDICSLKSPLLDIIKKAAISGMRIASIHPMFGSDVKVLVERNLVVCETDCKDITDEVRRLFSETSVNLLVVPIDKHDEFMTYVLGLSHFINLVFAKVLTESGHSFDELNKISSSTFNAQTRVTIPVSRENQNLYFEVQNANLHTKDMIERLNSAISSYRDTIVNDNRDLFKQFMDQGMKYFADGLG